MALHGELSRKEYIDGYGRIEFESKKQLRRFTKEIWTPWATQNDFEWSTYFLYEQKLDSYDYDKWFRDIYYLAAKAVGDYYDKRITPYVSRRK